MIFYLILLFIFNVLTINTMQRSLCPIEDFQFRQEIQKEPTISFTSLPEEMHNNICKYSSIRSVGRIQQTCTALNNYYNFEALEENIKYENYNLCSQLILKLTYAKNKYKQMKALAFLQLNESTRRKNALVQLYGKDIISLIETKKPTDKKLDLFFIKLTSPLSVILEETTILNPVGYTIKPEIDSFAIQIICCSDDNEIIDTFNNRLIHYLISSIDHLSQITCENSNTNLLDALIKSKLIKKSSCNIANIFGDTALHLICNHGDTTVFKCLVDSEYIEEETFNCANEDGNTPLHLACESGNSIIAKELINLKKIKREVFNLPNIFGNTPLHLACAGCDETVIEQLINSGFIKEETFKLINQDEETPLDIAYESGNTAIVTLLNQFLTGLQKNNYPYTTNNCT